MRLALVALLATLLPTTVPRLVVPWVVSPVHAAVRRVLLWALELARGPGHVTPLLRILLRCFASECWSRNFACPYSHRRSAPFRTAMNNSRIARTWASGDCLSIVPNTRPMGDALPMGDYSARLSLPQ